MRPVGEKANSSGARAGAPPLQVVVLMGGVGSRLGSVTAATPKSMLQADGRPFFAHMLDVLKRYNFSEFLFLTGYLEQQVRDYFGAGESFGVRIAYSSDGPTRLGTAGAVRKALPLLADEFVLMYGDSYMDFDYAELLHLHRHFKLAEGKPLLMTVFANRQGLETSNVLFRDGRLLAYDKKHPTPEMAHCDYGVSVLTREEVARIPANEPADLADIYGRAVADGRMAGVEIRSRFYEIGRPDSLAEFRSFIADRRGRQRPAVFLDRDGTLNEMVFNDDTGQMDSPLAVEQLRLLPGVADALKKLAAMGFLLIVATNQPAAAKGKTSLAELYRINARLDELLREEGVVLDDIVTCPHHPTGEPTRCPDASLLGACGCRKPGSLMLARSIARFNIDRARSFAVGDSPVDIQAGRREGIRGVFLGDYKCESCRMLAGARPDLLCADLGEFAARVAERKADEDA